MAPIKRYTFGRDGMRENATGEYVLFDHHQQKVEWLLRLKAGVEEKVRSTYRSYLSLWRDAKRLGVPHD